MIKLNRMAPTYLNGRPNVNNNNNNGNSNKMNNLKKVQQQRPASWAYTPNDMLLHDTYVNYSNNNNKFLTVSSLSIIIIA